MAQVDIFLTESRGFMRSRVILTAAELDIFTLLDEKPRSAEALAAEKNLDARAATRVMDCLISLGLLKKSGGIYKLTENSIRFSSRHSETVLPMLLHMNRLWNTWSSLTEVVRQRSRSEDEPGIHFDESGWRSFIGAMHVIGRDLAQVIARDYDLTRFKRLLDIGGASGTYTIAFLQRNPAMTAVIFDLENVIPMAKERISEARLERSVDLVAGNFYHDKLPRGCDLALLSAIIHQNSPEQNLDLFTRIFDVLEPGGTLLIRDHIMDESRTHPPAGAMFALNMLVNTQGGDTYTLREVKEWYEKAGFTDVKQVRHGEAMDCLVEGRKPA